MKSEKIRGCLITVMFFLLLAGVLIAGIAYRTNYAKTELAFYDSEDGHYRLTVFMIGEPDWPFGATHCRFDLARDGKRIIKCSFSILNDGASAHADNFRITWNPDNVTITVSGSEQSGTKYVLNFDGTVS